MRNSDESQLDAEQRRIWNDCKAGPRGSVPPPVHVWLKSPGLADNAHKLGAHVRFGTPVHPEADRDRDPDDGALLDGAVRMGGACPPRAAGRADAGRDRRDRRAPHAAFTDPDDQLVYDFCRDYYDDHRVDDATYERVVERLATRASSISPG